MSQKPRYYFTAKWFRGVFGALGLLANIFVAAKGYSIGGTEGYFQLFAAGTALYFIYTSFSHEN